MFQSDLLPGGSTITLKAGPLAIAQNDLVALTSTGLLYSANVTDYAAVASADSGIVPATAFGIGGGSVDSSGKGVLINPADGSIWVCTPQGSTAVNVQVSKFNTLGVLQGTYILDNTSGTTMGTPCLSVLSNGNILVVWQQTGPVYFAIFDPSMNLVVAKTTVVASGANVYIDAISLTAGGFAVAYCVGGTGVLLAIYTNAGGVTFAPTLIPSTPASLPGVRMAQLSSGNIAIAITSTTASKALGYAIRSITGTAVVVYAVLDAASASQISYPEITAMTGFFACGVTDNTNAVVYVLNNAGVTQGSALSNAEINQNTVSQRFLKVLNDGVGFWVIIVGLSIWYITTAGANSVATTGATTVPSASFDAFIDRSFLVWHAGTTYGGKVQQINPGATGQLIPMTALSAFSGSVTGNLTIRPLGDFAYLLATDTTVQKFAIAKYVSASVIGTAQTALAAGNSGTLTTVSPGAGNRQINPLLGSPSRAFSHGQGNRGVIYQNTVVMQGIANLRPIN